MPLSFRTGLPLLLACFCLAPAASHAANPVISTAYSADPAAHVFGGRMYIYASHDRNDAQDFDMIDYHVYSSDDLQNWRDHGIAFRASDSPWAKAHLWAPDCVFRNGKYYLYYPAEDLSGNRHVGVAVSTSPAGPFTDTGQPIAGVTGIDPAVFIDGDGQAYIFWQSADATGSMARLKPDMVTLAEAPRTIAGAENFFEGPWMFKRQGLYYLTYPAFRDGGVGRGGHGQNFDYATASSPEGPFTYRGTFSRSGPGGENIHGAQVEWQGKWYGFYHDFSRSVGRDHQDVKRVVRMDEIHFAPDGAILPQQWTDAGPAQLHPLNARARNEAETMNLADAPENDHAIAVSGNAGQTVYVGPAQPGAWVKYAGVDFGAGVSTLTLRAASATGGGTLVVRLDAADGPLVASCTVPYTGGWDRWHEATCAVSGATGVHDLYFLFAGTGHSGLFTLDWYQFGDDKAQ